ncbi:MULTISPECIES: hypothetical protein [unclassified Nocardia]|uniref:hypothetical protein n=1 Tax=unclassified Nocardia TaxID=2637762 RepID=UPI001CE42EE4|nr:MULTISPECIES: hypothetical protein [unclassified Nocardia]
MLFRNSLIAATSVAAFGLAGLGIGSLLDTETPSPAECDALDCRRCLAVGGPNPLDRNGILDSPGALHDDRARWTSQTGGNSSCHYCGIRCSGSR